MLTKIKENGVLDFSKTDEAEAEVILAIQAVAKRLAWTGYKVHLQQRLIDTLESPESVEMQVRKDLLNELITELQAVTN